MRVLIIDAEGAGLDFAMRCMEHGHEVKTFVREKDKLNGRGLIEKVSNWEMWMQWADVILPTGNDRYLDRFDYFHKLGYPIFGPTKQSAMLEIDRKYGMDMLKKAGVPIPEYQMFKNLSQAEAHCWKQDRRYVFKTLGSEEDKSLSYVAKDSADMINTFHRWKKTGQAQKSECMLQEFIPGVEFGVSAWMGSDGFLSLRGENVEHKKLMSGNYGANTGEMGCYDSETEVLTDSGWKYWPDVTMADKIASLEEGKTVFVQPSDVVSFDFIGNMVCWNNRTLDICVTPTHNMYVNSQSDARNGIDGYKFIAAKDCTQSQYEIQRTAGWEGVSNDLYEIPGYVHGKGNGYITVPPMRVPMIHWAKFLGFYIAEGSISGNTVNLSQSHKDKADRAEPIVSSIGIKYLRRNDGFNIYNAQLARHLKPLGRSWEKRIPDYIKSGSKDVIAAFLDGYCAGDGHIFKKTGHRSFYTSNKGLADDTQELLLKIGHVGIIKNRGISEAYKEINGRQIFARREAFEIIERIKKTRSWLDARDRTERFYSGKVYCATVPSHVMYVRRNGKPFWCGNTLMWYTEKSKLFDEVLKPMEKFLLSIGHRGDIDLNCIIDESGKPWVLEWTSRLGWPAFYVMCAQHDEPVEWMRDAIHGQDTLKASTDPHIGLVCTLPPFPNNFGQKDQTVGIPIQGITDKNWPHLHLCNAMAGRGVEIENSKPVMKEMLVTSGQYVFIASGSGKTIRYARKKAYQIADEITLPNKQVRDDIGEKFMEQLPDLQKHGFATGVTA